MMIEEEDDDMILENDYYPGKIDVSGLLEYNKNLLIDPDPVK